MRSALFVDFDNIHIRLAEQDNSLAEAFSTNPLQWVSWLEQTLPMHHGSSDSDRRRILIRRSYLNPRTFGRYRPYFIRSAFETIDCPTLTSFGKTSADVHMVLDMLELLQHEVRFDEYIVMSADADFTPVLLKLRRWDVRTTVLAIGTSATAYRAAADLLIDQDQFCDEALGIEASPGAVARPEESPVSITKNIVQECSRLVTEHVRAADAPVTMAVLAALVRRNHREIGGDWGGGSFKQFLAGLDLEDLQTSTVTPGYVYDPQKHTPPTGTESLEHEEQFRERYPELEPLARKIHDLTDTPYLMPEHFTFLLDSIAREVNGNGYSLSRVSKAVRDVCKDQNIPVGRQHVNFVLRGMSFAGHRFGEQEETREALADDLVKNTLSLCSGAQLDLSEDETTAVRTWLGGVAEGD